MLLKKKATFPVKNIFLLTFSRGIEHGKCQQTNYKGLESLFDRYCASYEFVSI